MKYNLSNDAEFQQALEYVHKLAEKGKVVDIVKKEYNRSLPQNAYLHLLLSAFAVHFGYTLEEAKTIYKELNKDIYWYKKKGRVFLRSSSDLDKEEMAKTIDKFMEKSAEGGYELPLATNQEYMRQIENEIESQRRYL